MKKWFSWVMMAALTASLLAGCGTKTVPADSGAGTGATAQPAAEPQPAEKIKLRFMTAETDPPSVEAFEKIIKAFEDENPGVTVSLELVGADDLVTKLPAGIATGEVPDVSQVDSQQVVDYARQGHLLALDDVVDAIGRDDFVPGSLMDIDGHVYNMPYAGSGTVMWVRKDLFQQHGVKIPANWNELVAAAKALTLDTNGDKQTDIYGIVLPAGANGWTGHVLNMFMWQNGQSMFDQDLNPTFDTPRTVEALRIYKELAQYAPPGIGSYSFYETIDAFVTGKVAMAPYMGRLLSKVAADNPDLLPNTMAIPMPSQINSANYGGWDSYAVFKGSQNPDMARKFAAYLTTGEHAGLFLRTVPGHLVPPLKSMLKSDALWNEPLMQSNRQDVETVFQAAQGTALHPSNEAGAMAADGTLTTQRRLNPYMNAIMGQNVRAMAVQMVLLENKPAEEAAAWAQAEMERIMAENR